MSQRCVIGPQGKCELVTSSDMVPSSTPVYIIASAGLNGVNRSEDVGVIQNALNRVAPEMGGPTPQLAQDGICGPLTRRAIQRFQQRQFGWNDGRVDPGQKTLARLNEMLSGPGTISLVAPLSANPTLLDKAKETIPPAKLWVSQALANLRIARPIYAGSIKPPGINPYKSRVDTHFHLEKAIDPVSMIDKIIANYMHMDAALKMDPLFEIDTVAPGGFYAHGPFGGFHSPGKVGLVGVTTEVSPGVIIDYRFKGRMDRIYICSAFEELWIKSRTAVVVHELAHFVGGSDGSSSIRHFAEELPFSEGRGVEGCTRNYAHLHPEEAIRNAASYATYAIHTFYGFDNRAGWI